MAAPIFDRRISNLNNLRQDDSILPCTVMFWSKLWPIFLFYGGAKQSKGHPIQQKGRQYIYICIFHLGGGAVTQGVNGVQGRAKPR